MNVMKKVPKNLIGSIPDNPKRKKCLTEEEVNALLTGHVIIDEKVDGGVLGLAWGGYPLAVGKHHMINYDRTSKKFYGLRQWIYDNYEKISKIPLGWIVYGEWMGAQHNIPYIDLPDFFICFDIFDGVKKRFLNCIDRTLFLDALGFEKVPTIYSGSDLKIVDLIRLIEGAGQVSNKSMFNCNETIEGIIVRNDNGLIGKYVRREFSDSIEENWLTLPLIENRLASWKLKMKDCEF